MANAKTTKACPICGQAAVERYKPFCSRRCANIDLNRWLSGVYAVPGADGDEEEEPRDQGGGRPN